MKLFFIVFLTIFMSVSCSKDPIYTQAEFVDMAVSFDPKVYQVPIPNHEPHRRILCRDYGEGCLEGTGRRLMIRKVELIAISFETPAQAKAEAKRIDQYYARNWLLDDVKNEPVLIDFVQRVYQAKPGRD